MNIVYDNISKQIIYVQFNQHFNEEKHLPIKLSV